MEQRLRRGVGEDCAKTLSAIDALQKALSAEFDFDVGVSAITLAPQRGCTVMQLQRRIRHLKETVALRFSKRPIARVVNKPPRPRPI